ncbi:TIGR03826 family flagellar region protein [Salimicrobium flavidum]|uniref:Flagellar operon protein TIGR03826 n=1 Tax=Salimicrobium flavidum TaxID=570947 RepID=A0A1N7J165_9BACI|nr:TIGR03826 family flagellar region protein [Salimicrobium flavidum]SIS42961.1 flagellar operon protein TIGR03826 [Salimicrobium flavidum]
MAEPANCPRCGKLFMKGPQTVCDGCRKQEEDDFQTVYKFLRYRENRSASVEQISEATEVEEDQIRKFVKERRLHPANFPSLSYECERCGTHIQEGRMCASCSDEMSQGIRQHERDKELGSRVKERENQAMRKSMTYYSVNKDKK